MGQVQMRAIIISINGYGLFLIIRRRIQILPVKFFAAAFLYPVQLNVISEEAV